MILAITGPDDAHADAVLADLARMGRRTARLDLADLPQRVALTLRRGGGGARDALHGAGPGGGPLWLDEVRAVWWRRPRPAAADPSLSGRDAAYAVAQAQAALAGVWASLRCAWMNEPWADDRADQKPAQLAAAEAAGLAVPPTLVTSDPAEARAFLDELAGGEVMVKPLRAGSATQWARRLRPRDRERLDDLRLAPAILQRYVPGLDVRVTCAGGRLLATAVDARATAWPDDFRRGFDQAAVTPYALPAATTQALHGYLAALRLRYAAVDLRIDADGRPWFLEANPSGQWLFMEDRTGQPITAAVAEALADAADEVTPGLPVRLTG